MKTPLDTVLAILSLIIGLGIILFAFTYSILDKRRFRIEYKIQKNYDLFCRWASLIRGLMACGVMPASDDVINACVSFCKTKKFIPRVRDLSTIRAGRDLFVRADDAVLTDATAEDFAEFQRIDDLLKDFFLQYNGIRKEYNTRLEWPIISWAAKTMRFYPLPDLNA